MWLFIGSEILPATYNVGHGALVCLYEFLNYKPDLGC